MVDPDPVGSEHRISNAQTIISSASSSSSQGTLLSFDQAQCADSQEQRTARSSYRDGLSEVRALRPVRHLKYVEQMHMLRAEFPELSADRALHMCNQLAKLDELWSMRIERQGYAEDKRLAALENRKIARMRRIFAISLLVFAVAAFVSSLMIIDSIFFLGALSTACLFLGVRVLSFDENNLLKRRLHSNLPHKLAKEREHMEGESE
ncbi:MAG: hypothetical protein AAGF11_43290 [Myxococcota bacterium]